MATLYWIHAISPLHVGSGRGVGFIDLPIMREKVTNWPIVPGSAVKGVLAARCEVNDASRKSNPIHKAAFGLAGDVESSAGGLVVTDARIVCLPVRSLYGTFAWVTSPMVLERLRRDAAAAGAEVQSWSPLKVQDQEIVTLDNSDLKREKKVYLEDLDLDVKQDANIAGPADLLAQGVFASDSIWQDHFKNRFAVVSDDVFSYLCEFGTQVNAHIKIDENSKTVAKGALWYQESLPAEAILSGLAWCDSVANGQRQSIQELIFGKEMALQLGGNATTGMGRVRCIFGADNEGGHR